MAVPAIIGLKYDGTMSFTLVDSATGTSLLIDPDELVDTGKLATASLGDIVVISSGVNVTAGKYEIVSLAGTPNSVTLHIPFTAVGDGSAINYKLYGYCTNSITGTSLLANPDELVEAGQFGSAVVGDIVRINGGVNVIAGDYAVTDVTGAPDSITLDGNFTAVGDGANIDYDIMKTYTITRTIHA